AGSIVTTATLAPAAAIPSAMAADVVVLPTPPDPAHTHTRLPSSISATFTAPPPGHRRAVAAAAVRGGQRTRREARPGARRRARAAGRAARAGCRRGHAPIARRGAPSGPGPSGS